MRGFPIALILVLACGPAAVVAVPAPPDVTRTLRTVDFDERRFGNAEDLPSHWVKVRGPNLPHYVNGRLDARRRRSGKYAFRFDLNGGGLVYRYDYGQIPVREGAHYRVETFCQTTPLARARARLTAYFTDADGHPLDDTIRHSAPHASRTPDEPWTALSVELSAGAAAAFLVVELGLLQPEHYAASSLGDRTLHTQEIHGSAWFDDVSVSQVPRVTLSTDRPGNLFRRGEPLRLDVRVNDRFTDDLAAQLVIRDAGGKTVYQRSGALEIAGARTLGPGQKAMTLDLPRLDPGWYDATLVMSSRGQYVGEESLHLIHLADAGASPASAPDGRFGVIATDLPPEGWGQLPDLLPMLSAGRVKLAVWSAAGDISGMPAGAFDDLLERLGSRGITPTACLLDVPPRIADKLDHVRTNDGVGQWTRLARSDPALWQPELAYLVARHANHLDRWQLGGDGSDAFATKPAMRDVYARMHAQFAALVDKPDLAMPWPAWYELDGKLPATVALSIPPSVLPSQLPLYIRDARGRDGGRNVSISLQLLDRQRYGREMQIRDFAQRVVHALAAGATRIDMPLPFSVRRRGDVIVQQPDELLMIVRTLTTTLGGADYMGKVPIADGVEAFLFDRDGKGILAIWDRSAARRVVRPARPAPARDPPRRAAGERRFVGQRHAAAQPGRRAGGRAGERDGRPDADVPRRHRRPDGAAARQRRARPAAAGVELPRPRRRLRFTNLYKGSIGGTVRSSAPPGWTINPPTFGFTLDPGETFDKELTIEFPYNSFAGPKTINADFAAPDGHGRRRRRVHRAGRTEPRSKRRRHADDRARDGDDVIVQQMITNYGDRPIDYDAFAIFPGQARQVRLVTRLNPGRTGMKTYRFPSVRMTPDAKVRVGVKEMQGTRILHEEVAVQ